MDVVAGAVTAPVPVRVMIVDDSAAIRGLFNRMLASDAGITVAGSAPNGRTAIQLLPELDPDVIVLDIEMPVMDGLTALPKLLAAKPGVKVVIVSSWSGAGTETTVRALELGAADCLPKPAAGPSAAAVGIEREAFRRNLIAKIHALGRKPHRTAAPCPAPHLIARSAPGAPRTLRAMPRTPPAVLAIGSSTGGPQALMTFLSHLRADITVPILIAQHMPPKFTAVLAAHIARTCNRRCDEGRDGEDLAAGRIYLAPGGRHLKAGGSLAHPRIGLSDEPPENFCRPAVDVLFRSVAGVFGRRALGIILTGIGSDGTLGAEHIVQSGGSVLAQDEDSSVVWGMPGSVARAGLCSALLSPNGLADEVNALVEPRRR